MTIAHDRAAAIDAGFIPALVSSRGRRTGDKAARTTVVVKAIGLRIPTQLPLGAVLWDCNLHLIWHVSIYITVYMWVMPT